MYNIMYAVIIPILVLCIIILVGSVCIYRLHYMIGDK